jgi:hypothetical protein
VRDVKNIFTSKISALILLVNDQRDAQIPLYVFIFKECLTKEWLRAYINGNRMEQDRKEGQD